MAFSTLRGKAPTPFSFGGETPQKTIQPVAKAAGPFSLGGGAPTPTPTATPQRYDLAGLQKLGVVGQDVLNPLFASKNFTGVGDGYGPTNNRWFGPETQGPGDAGMYQGAALPTNGSWLTHRQPPADQPRYPWRALPPRPNH